MDIKEKAKMYAEGKALNAITSAIEEAYAEGYKDGYKDCIAKVDNGPIEEIVDWVKYVDLGLPSGKEWSEWYFKRGERIWRKPDMLTYQKASELNIPTKEDFLELIKYCKMIPMKDIYDNVLAWSLKNEKTGKDILLYKSERVEYIDTIKNESFMFWLRDANAEDDERLCADGSSQDMFRRLYKDHKLPVMLVRKKRRAD